MAKARIVYVVDDKELKELDKELKGIQKENKKVEEGFKGTNEELKKTKTSAIDLKGAVAGLGLVAHAGAAIKEFIQLNAEIAKSRKEVALLTKATGLALDNITAKLRATSKVFDKDFNEILRTANTVSKEFGVSMTDALDEINEGFTRGLDINGEYLETLREYSTFIKEAGLNTRQFNVLIQQQAQQGIFSDKGIDAIKEAVLSIREMTPATRDAIRGVGIDTKKMTSDIQSGVKTYFEAVQEIAAKTRELADPVKTGTILADVFRGAGEDAGNFIFTLDKLGDEFAELTDEQQAYVDAQDALLKATEKTQRELLNLTSSTQGLGIAIATFWENIKSGTISGLNLLIQSFQTSETIMENYRKKIAGGDKESLDIALKDLNEELVIAEKELKRVEEQTDENSLITKIWKENVNELNIKITEAEAKLNELEQAEIDEAEAAKEAEIAAIELAEAKKLQVEATEKARKESEAAAKAMEKEAEAQRKATEATKENLELKSKGVFEGKSDFLQEVEAKAELNELLIEQEKKLNEDLAEINKNRIDTINEAEEEGLTERGELILSFAQGTADIVSGFAQLKINQINNELQAVEFARNRELELAEQTGASKDAINKKFDAQAAVLRNKQVEAEKRSAVFQSLIATGVAVAQALPNIALSILAGVLGAAQTAFILAQPVPKFAEGVLRFKGKGTRTSDSNLVQLSNEETVLSAQTTDDYYPAVKAIYNREISPDIMNNIAMHQDTRPQTIVYDYDKLAKAVMNQPQKSLIADENGLTGYFLRQGKSLEIKQAKYKM